MAVANEFQERSLRDSLQRLMFANIINDEQVKILEEYYKKDPRNYADISREIYKIEGHDEKLLKDILMKAAEKEKDVKLEGVEEKKENPLECKKIKL